MGIVNVTPDSFSDGGDHASATGARDHALKLVENGADIVDIGGESTRPGATPVSEQEELDRVIPVVEAVSRAVAVPVSIDTFKPVVMREAVAAGAGLINDVFALSREGSLEMAAKLNVPVCLMHMLREPSTMQDEPHYDNVIEDIFEFLYERRAACIKAGINSKQLVVDPGFGFGKTLLHNLKILDGLPRFRALASPILIGLSRKGMVGQITGLGGADRDIASAALAARAAGKGARILRVHDVRTTRHVVRTLDAANHGFWSELDEDTLASAAQARF